MTHKELQEEVENLEEFSKLQQDFKDLLEKIETYNVNEHKEIADEDLVYLHLNLSYSIWHIEQIHELVKKLMQVRGQELLESKQEDTLA